MLWACIHLPHLAIDSVLRRHPEPDKPLALVGGTPLRREIVSLNRAAFDAGLRPGMRLAAAHALLDSFAMVDYQEENTQRWQQFLGAWAYRFSSQVIADWPGCILLEAQKSFAILGQWPIFEARLRQDLKALGFRHRIALAPTPRAARVLASVQDGLAVEHIDHLRNTLARVPVRRAWLPDDVGQRLHKMGVRHMRQVFELPRDALRRRFGWELLAHLDRLTGDAPEMMECFQPPDIFDMRVELNFEVEHHQALMFPVRRMTADLAAYLAGRDGGVQQFTLSLEHEDKSATNVEIGLLSAERDPGMLFELTKGRLERAAVPAPVVALRLTAKHLPPFVPEGRDLFDDGPATVVPWPQLRERLRARLGNDAVYQLAMKPDPRPEHAWQRDDGSKPLPDLDRPPRPTWLLKRPIPLHDPHIEIIDGPERVGTGWWDDGDARRDYYRLRTSRGQHAWAFTGVDEQGPWMLHGWFA
jgi:protein ImuB